MNYTDIKTFLTISTSESLSKAAETLYISQPALSHRLASLEAELGSALIFRKKGVRTIELTEAGKRFIPIAHKWESLWLETEGIKYTDSLIPLRISNVDSLNTYFMPNIYTRFLEDNSGIKISTSTLRSNAAYHAIENKEVDIALISNHHFSDKVKTIPLFKEPMKFICSSDSSYMSPVEVSELNPADEIFIPWSNSFSAWHDYWFGAGSDVKVRLDSISLMEHLLKMKKAWAVIPSTIAHVLCKSGEYRTCSLNNIPEPRTCYALTEKTRIDNELTEKFIKVLLDVADTFPEVTIIDEATS